MFARLNRLHFSPHGRKEVVCVAQTRRDGSDPLSAHRPRVPLSPSHSHSFSPPVLLPDALHTSGGPFPLHIAPVSLCNEHGNASRKSLKSLCSSLVLRLVRSSLRKLDSMDQVESGFSLVCKRPQPVWSSGGSVRALNPLSGVLDSRENLSGPGAGGQDGGL